MIFALQAANLTRELWLLTSHAMAVAAGTTCILEIAHPVYTIFHERIMKLTRLGSVDWTNDFY